MLGGFEEEGKYGAAPHSDKLAYPYSQRSDAVTDICLRGQRQRRFLLEQVCRKGSRSTFNFPREWSIRHESDGRWYLNFCYETVDKKKVKEDQKLEKKLNGVFDWEGRVRVKSIDPGAGTPFTVYTSEGRTIDIGGEEDRARLRRLRLAGDELQSQINAKRPLNRRPSRNVSRDKRKRRYAQPPQEPRKLKKKRLYIMSKIKNLIRELHCRTAHYLFATSNIIVMPRMEVNSMIKRRRGRLPISTKRELLTWSHSAFVHRLATKCHDIQYDRYYPERKDLTTTLLIQPEAYTSKTCGRCGQINDRLGSTKVFKCPQPDCNYEADRDHNGAFDMIVKAIR